MKFFPRGKSKRSDDTKPKFSERMIDREAFYDFEQTLNQNASRSAQLFRGNHGGGFPCPDDVCTAPKVLDNL